MAESVFPNNNSSKENNSRISNLFTLPVGERGRDILGDDSNHRDLIGGSEEKLMIYFKAKSRGSIPVGINDTHD